MLVYQDLNSGPLTCKASALPPTHLVTYFLYLLNTGRWFTCWIILSREGYKVYRFFRSAALKLDTLWQPITLISKLFQSMIVFGKNEFLYVSVDVCLTFNCAQCLFLIVLVLNSIWSLGGMATCLLVILYIMVRRLHILLFCSVSQPRSSSMAVTLLVRW